MNLEQKINEELKNSMKAGLKDRTDAIRAIRSAIIEFNKSGTGKEMTEEDGIKLLNVQAKRRRDAMDMYEKAGRPDLFEKEKAELEVIQEFLPKQLSDEEVADVVKNVIAEIGATGMKDMGKAMGACMKALAGKTDGNKVQTVVKDILGAM
eukprot:TRINITY_DN8645_c0_g1_i1.p2 TRINITY_DN8645_c0_g1~~TRINITY_DN8645_c0_g1_i1.p2  ORF type:complete len:151 (+),score=8.32 TRINITY_DN8645_c0_g1_i1:164-616(+)